MFLHKKYFELNLICNKLSKYMIENYFKSNIQNIPSSHKIAEYMS